MRFSVIRLSGSYAGQHVLVTRHQADFRDVLPQAQVANWIDEPPEAALPGELPRRASHDPMQQEHEEKPA
jgi:hypothetical protein